jgi:hypothetical protein
MVGALFYRGVPPSEINAMGYSDLSYWFEWHETIEAEELAAVERAKAARG